MTLDIRPLTPQLWPALEDLFGPNGACAGCWCMYWRIGGAYHKRPREENKADFRRIVEQGPPPGLLAFRNEIPVGWCQLTPRSALPSLARARFARPVDDLPVWSLSCFYVRRGHRRQGVSAALIQAALKAAKRASAPAVEAYPFAIADSANVSSRFTGIASTFERAGFRTVARHNPHRPIMRHDLCDIVP